MRTLIVAAVLPMAAAGVRSTNASVTWAVCSPTRAGLITGR